MMASLSTPTANKVIDKGDVVFTRYPEVDGWTEKLSTQPYDFLATFAVRGKGTRP